MPDHRSLGRRGESIAAAWLEKKGYRIIERNFHTRYGEIDLVARCGGEIVFIEVKTRTGRSRGTPADAVDARKSLHWQRAAEIYLSRRRCADAPFRFDFVGVDLSGTEPCCELITDALY